MSTKSGDKNVLESERGTLGLIEEKSLLPPNTHMDQADMYFFRLQNEKPRFESRFRLFWPVRLGLWICPPTKWVSSDCFPAAVGTEPAHVPKGRCCPRPCPAAGSREAMVSLMPPPRSAGLAPQANMVARARVPIWGWGHHPQNFSTPRPGRVLPLLLEPWFPTAVPANLANK